MPNPTEYLLNTESAAVGLQSADTMVGKLRLLQLLAVAPVSLQGVTATANNSHQLGTLNQITLPNNRKAASILRVSARGAASTKMQEYADKGINATPTTTTAAVAPNGDIVFLASDAVTDVDVWYIPTGMEATIDLFLPVASSIATLPLTYSIDGQNAINPRNKRAIKVFSLLECEAITGTTTGKNIIIAPGAVSTTTKQANLDPTKLTVQFVVADAVTACRVRLGILQEASFP